MREQILSETILKPLEVGLKRAAESYNALIAEDIPSDPKGFTAYHNACKAALMHIALAAKITESLTPKDAPDTAYWLDLAKEALKTEEDNDIVFS